MQLSTNLKAVISQLLLPAHRRPGRVAVFELMINTPSIAALIRDNKTFRIAERHPDRLEIRHGLARMPRSWTSTSTASSPTSR